MVSVGIRWVGYFYWAVLAGYLVFLAMRFTLVAGGADSSGYLNSAKLMMQGHLSTEYRKVPGLEITSVFDQTPLGFTFNPRYPVAETPIVPGYPSGLPLQLAGWGVLIGPKVAAYLVFLGNAAACALLFYLLARRLNLTRELALAGAVVLVANAIFIFSATQPMSDMVATAWCLAAGYLALRASEGWRYALGCGAAFGMAILVRPTNIVLLPTIVLFSGQWRAWLRVAVGGLPAMLWMLGSQRVMYGEALKSGYGDVTPYFHLSNFVPTLKYYWESMSRMFPVPVLILILGLGWARSVERRILAGLGLWVIAIFGFYWFYDVTQEAWFCMRFVLPAFPPLILLSLLGARALAERYAPRRAGLVLASVSVVFVVWAVVLGNKWSKRLGALGPSKIEHYYEDITIWANANLPRNAVVASMQASGAVFYYTEFPLLRWDTMTRERFSTYAERLERLNRPLFAIICPVEESKLFREHVGYNWKKIKEIGNASVWEWTKPEGGG